MNRKQRRVAAIQQRRSQQQSVSISEALKLAIKLHQHERLDEAEKIYRQILDTRPDHPDALHYFGVFCHQKGNSNKAIELIRKAISISPEYADAHNNLGNVLKESGRFEDAAQSYRTCLSLSADNVNALSNLGAVLRESGELDEALTVLKRAIELAPSHYQAYHNLGNVYKKLGQYSDAIISYRKSIELMHPDQAAEVIGSVYKSLTRTLYLDQRHDEAIGVLKQWLAFDPDNAIAKHMLAACSGKDIPERASNAFVAETFDVFAGSFDEVLKRLDYRAPELIASAIRKYIPTPSRNRRILDAGCGTGLCGPLLRDYAHELVGVDLSKKMIDKAKGRNLYDELFVAELTGFMGEQNASYDLIASADTFCYFGDLTNLMYSATVALRNSGLLIFTLENILDTETYETYYLNPHGRYSHNLEYVSKTLQDHGMSILSIEQETLRNEAGKPVEGLIVSAINNSTQSKQLSTVI